MSSATDQFVKVAEGVWQFTSRLEGRHQPCHGYILTVGKELWLIDPPGDLEPKRIEKNFAGLSVGHIFITHLQEEHATGATHYPAAAIHIPDGDQYLCQGPEFYQKQITVWTEPWDWDTRGNYQGSLGGREMNGPFRIS